MTVFTDAFLADLTAAMKDRLRMPPYSRQIEALAAVTASRLEAQEARLAELEATVKTLVEVHNGR
jgi:hypothetical protein